jgi:hypothetical protein
MCSFVDLIINEGKPNETTVTQQVDCKNPNCPSSDASTGGTK